MALDKLPGSLCTAWILQFSRFSLVGILNTIVGYGAFLILLGHVNYMIALILAHFIGVCHSYVWNRRWTFKSRGIKTNEFLRFNSVYLAVLAVNALTLAFLVEWLGIRPEIGQLIALPVVTVISFTGHKHWSFKKKGKNQ
ncbi:MAG: GtrA family protein [Methanotrichaceae archaeon]|nr:GtrA family protein [Methanotrichaceae archaeon]